jgi:hypothetical protein
MNTKKIIGVIKEKCKDAPQRTEDYHKALLDTVSDVVYAEYKHTIQKTTIEKDITDLCEALGDFIERTSTSKGK